MAKYKVSWVISDGGRKLAFPEMAMKHKRIGDCVIRATALALEIPYEDAWDDLFFKAILIGLFPNHDDICKQNLLDKGWEEIKFGKELVRMDDKRILDLSKDRWIICYTREHWVAMKDATIYDTWQSFLNSMGDYSRVFRVYYKP
jgi:hypothetical protein